MSARVWWKVSWSHNLATETYDSYEQAVAAVHAVAPKAVGEFIPEGPTDVWWSDPEDRDADCDGEDPYVRVLATITRCEEEVP